MKKKLINSKLKSKLKLETQDNIDANFAKIKIIVRKSDSFTNQGSSFIQCFQYNLWELGNLYLAGHFFR